MYLLSDFLPDSARCLCVAHDGFRLALLLHGNTGMHHHTPFVLDEEPPSRLSGSLTTVTHWELLTVGEKV